MITKKIFFAPIIQFKAIFGKENFGKLQKLDIFWNENQVMHKNVFRIPTWDEFIYRKIHNFDFNIVIFSDFWGPWIVGSSWHQKIIWLELIRIHMPSLCKQNIEIPSNAANPNVASGYVSCKNGIFGLLCIFTKVYRY